MSVAQSTLQKTEAVNTNLAVIHEYGRTERAANPSKFGVAHAREAVRVFWHWCLPESVRGEACSCQDSREGRFPSIGDSGEHRALRVPMNQNGTLLTLNF